MRMVIAVMTDPAKSERIAASLGKIAHVLCVEIRGKRHNPPAL